MCVSKRRHFEMAQRQRFLRGTHCARRMTDHGINQVSPGPCAYTSTDTQSAFHKCLSCVMCLGSCRAQMSRVTNQTMLVGWLAGSLIGWLLHGFMLYICSIAYYEGIHYRFQGGL